MHMAMHAINQITRSIYPSPRYTLYIIHYTVHDLDGEIDKNQSTLVGSNNKL